LTEIWLAKMKTGVLVHGCNLHIENWRYVAWGDPPHHLGRIPQGILTALEFDASVIVFGTGASEKVFNLGESEKAGQLLAEGEYSLEYLKSHFAELANFAPLKPHFEKHGVDHLAEWVLSRLELDLESMNTLEEIRNGGLIFGQHEVERIVLVSSPSHIVRCLRDAASIFRNEAHLKDVGFRIFANPSYTCYEGTEPNDVVVVEPPHRPDRHVVPTHRRIHRMMMLQQLPYEDVVELIQEFDDLLQKYENRYHSG